MAKHIFTRDVCIENGRGESFKWKKGTKVEIVHNYPLMRELVVRAKTEYGMRRARVPHHWIA